MFRSLRVAALGAALFSLGTSAAAQGLGVGARFAMMKATDAQEGRDRLTGAMVRAHLSPRTALELSMDWRTATNEAETLRTRDNPIQASLFLYPVRTTVAPYLLGGVGWYSQKIETLENGQVTRTESVRPFGYHAGFGVQLWLGGHAALNFDYRYNHVTFGDDEETEEESDESSGLRIPVLSSVAEKIGLSHDGSMWTAGLSVYF
jgi:opacity protein-like surface antigen